MATGVLPIAIGDGTKILQFLLAEDKSYRATLQLGKITDTLDAEGQIIAEYPVPENLDDLLPAACLEFTGSIEQIPPMYSALKKDGVPLYKLARQGIEVERKARQVHIDRLDLLQFDQSTATIEVACSKGTYIRTLADDIGKKLGCGAHLIALERQSTGPFALSDCCTFEQLEDSDFRTQALLPIVKALRGVPEASLDSQAIQQLKFGIPPELKNTSLSDSSLKEGQLIKLCAADQLAAMAYYAPSRKKEKRGDYELIRVFNNVING